MKYMTESCIGNHKYYGPCSGKKVDGLPATINNTCTICQLTTSNLYLHMKHSHNTDEFKCSECPATFSGVQTFGRHLNQVHSDVPFKGSERCTDCMKYMTQPSIINHKVQGRVLNISLYTTEISRN